MDNSTNLNAKTANIRFCTTTNSTKDKFIIVEDDGDFSALWNSEDEFIEDMLNFRVISDQEMEIEEDHEDELQKDGMDIEENAE